MLFCVVVSSGQMEKESKYFRPELLLLHLVLILLVLFCVVVSSAQNIVALLVLLAIRR